MGEYRNEPWWLMLEIIGFEDDDDADDDGDDDSDDDTDDSESSTDDEGDDDDDDDDSDDDDDDDNKPVTRKEIKGLTSALRKERMARKKAQREARRYKERLAKSNKPESKSKDDKDSKDSKDDDKDEAKDTGPTERELKLAEKFKDRAVDTVILRLASNMNFVDPEDAVRLLSRKDIDVDQDEDDPTEIEVDEESVEDALKALVKKKKHLLKPKGSSTRSGSKMNGKKKSTSLDKEALRKKWKLNN